MTTRAACALASTAASDRLAVAGDVIAATVNWVPVTPAELCHPGAYRLFGANGQCLLAGRATRNHPLLRMLDHRYGPPWWPEAARGEYKLAASGAPWIPVTFSELHDGGVYRLFGDGGRCLYAGQCGIHPMVRMRDHCHKAPWWPQVTRGDYALLPGGTAKDGFGDTPLDALEHAVLLSLRPACNVKLGKYGWTRENEVSHVNRQAS